MRTSGHRSLELASRRKDRFRRNGCRSAVLLSTVAPRADNPYDRTDDRHNTENHKLDCVEGSNKPVPRPLRRDCDVDFDRNG